MNSSIPAPADPAERARFPYSLPGVLLIVALYVLVHGSTRLLASGNMGEDDPLDNILIQTLAAGYSAHIGPLYDWALHLLQKVLGPGIEAFLALKYACLISMAGLIFTLTRRISGSVLWAFIAVESLATVYQVFWRFHEGFTHRVGAMTLIVATLWAATRLLDSGKWRDYTLFAAFAGLGLLTEHTYALFLLALFLAGAVQPAMRRQLFSLRLLACLPLTLLIISPYTLWLMAEPQRSSEFFADLLPAIPDYSLRGILDSLRDALTFPIFVLAPYAVILPMVFPGILKFNRTPPANEINRFLRNILFIEFAGMIAFNGLLFSRASYPVHSILPLFLIAVIWLTERARQTAPTDFRVRVFMVILMGFTVTAYLVRSGNMFVYEPFCTRCRWGIPYDTLAESLRAQGFDKGTLVTNSDQVGANMRRFFPEARVVLLGMSVVPPAKPNTDTEKNAVVWSPADSGNDLPPALLALLPDQVVVKPPETMNIPWKHLWRPLGYRDSIWASAITEKRH